MQIYEDEEYSSTFPGDLSLQKRLRQANRPQSNSGRDDEQEKQRRAH